MGFEVVPQELGFPRLQECRSGSRENLERRKPQILISMDWIKGKFTGNPPYLMGKSLVSCKFSLKPIH
jgi:hypothetical protein